MKRLLLIFIAIAICIVPAAPAPAAIQSGPYQVTIFPDLKLTTDTVPPYREPVPSDPIEQIFYHHAPIVDKFRADTRLDSPVIDIAIASASLSRAAAGRPSPIVAPIAEQLIREPTRPVSAVIEMPGELALGVYRIPTVAIPHYKAHPEELPGLPGKIPFVSPIFGAVRGWAKESYTLFLNDLRGKA